MTTHYQCANCKGTFRKGRSDEEALAEYADNFGTTDVSDTVVVCDPCFTAMQAVLPIDEWRHQ